MKINSYQHRHKLALTMLLLTLFAVPFVLGWQNLNQHDTSTFMAGGAVVGRPTVSFGSEPVSNNSGTIVAVVGKTLLGAPTQ